MPIHDDEQPFTLIVGGAVVDSDLQFPAAWGVYVDNYTGRWVELPGIGTFVPPLTSRTLALPGVTKAQARFAAPGSQAQPAGTAGDVCILRFTARQVQPSGGLVGQPGVQAADIILIGTLGTRPVPAVNGRVYYATDTGEFYRDSGAAWVRLDIGTSQFGSGYRQSINNQNAVVARDFLGGMQNLLLLDADPPIGNVVLGPTDPRFWMLIDAWLHSGRQYFFDEFEGAVLKTSWTQTLTGAGNLLLPAGRTQAELRSAAVGAGDGVRLELRGWRWARANGERINAWLTMEDALTQNCEYGYASFAAPATDFVRFRVTEAGVATNWQAECSAGGAVTTVDTGVLRNATRRQFTIDTLSAPAASVDFYIDMVKVATINANIPILADIGPYLDMRSNGAIANRRVLVDTIECSGNR